MHSIFVAIPGPLRDDYSGSETGFDGAACGIELLAIKIGSLRGRDASWMNAISLKSQFFLEVEPPDKRDQAVFRVSQKKIKTVRRHACRNVRLCKIRSFVRELEGSALTAYL